jgi:glycosyltransferase involved in cell wall biosynthesis
MTIRVLHICKNIPVPGNKDNDVIIEQINEMKKNGIDVQTIYPKEIIPKILKYSGGRAAAITRLGNEFLCSGLRVTTLQYLRLPFTPIEWRLCHRVSFLSNRHFYNLLEVFCPQLIHAHYIFPDALIARELSRSLNIPYVITMREGDYVNMEKSKSNFGLAQKVVAEAAIVIGITPNLLRADLPYPKKTIVNNFINDDFYKFPSVTEKKKCHMVTIGKGIPRKNLDWVVNYAASRKELVTLDVIGAGETICQLKDDFSHYDNIRFLGEVSRKEIIECLDKSQIFALPSDGETFGLVYAEAAARGNIVVGLAGTGLSGLACSSFFFAVDQSHFNEILDGINELNELDFSVLSHKSTVASRAFSKKNYIRKMNLIYKNIVSEKI